MTMPLTIIVTTPTRDLAEFDAVAALAARLKRQGRVQVNIAALARASRYEMPPGGSPWHAYAAYNPALEKFVPHEAIAPHLPADFVADNRELMLEKAAILRRHGLGAAFWNYLPNFLPESFFEAYPHLRGPRTDHPRRSTVEAFAPCVDHPHMLAMIREMTAELVRLVPELGTFYFKTNDAGPGLCWSHWQYAGSNGPASCRGRAMGRRVRDMIDAVCSGAAEAGGALRVHFSGNFSAGELDDIAAQLPDHCSVRGRGQSPVTVGTLADRCYPVRGVFDPLGVLESLQALRGRTSPTLFVDLRCSYDRAMERLDTAEAIIDLVDGFLTEPAWGTLAVMQRLHDCCVRWAGRDDASRLMEAFVSLREAMKFKQAALPGLSTIYGGVSMRFITRPLVFDPLQLPPQDEAYFLPHVFNVSQERARLDWLDQHGSRIRPASLLGEAAGDPRLWTAADAAARFVQTAQLFESLGDAWRRQALGLRLYASIVRSCAHFFAAQVIRDRHGANAASPSPVDPWTGHPDGAVFAELMRDELDNAAEFERLLRDGGMDAIAHAHGPVIEDTFVLGEDLPDQVCMKQRLMRRHWRDADATLPPPNR
jgi:hypothetical protein